MMRAPDLATVYAAELKFAQATQDTVNGVRRTRAALRAALARPSTLAWAGGAAALAGFVLARRGEPRVRLSGRRRVEKEPKPSTWGLLAALVLRQALARLPGMLERLWAVRQQRAMAADSRASPVQPVVHPPERVFH